MNLRSFSRQPSAILSHWYAVIEGVHFSAQDFYRSIEDELTTRKVPRLRTSRVEFHEGSVASDKRIYLRLARERFAFDVCAAPFGTGYFFSLRFVEKPRSWLQLAVLVVLMTILWGVGSQAYYQARENFWWVIGLVGVAAAVWWIIKQQRENVGPTTPPELAGEAAIIPVEMPDLDTFLLNLAVVGDWYERIRKNTYHRHDTRLLYQTLITDIVKKKVDEVTSAKGVKLIRTYNYSPILGELYQRKVVKTGQEGETVG